MDLYKILNLCVSQKYNNFWQSVFNLLTIFILNKNVMDKQQPDNNKELTILCKITFNEDEKKNYPETHKQWIFYV